MGACAYDGVGNITAMGSDAFANDPVGRLSDAVLIGDITQTPKVYTISLRDLSGKVTRELTYTPSTQSWVWKKDNVYREGALLASVSATDGIRHYHLDHLGSPRLVTNRCGEQYALFAYFPFGQEIVAGSQDGSEKMRFTGHERDLGLLDGADATKDDLDYMHARYYNPMLARFLATDPVRGTPEAPQSWNLYSYVRNNPVTSLDPDGKLPNQPWVNKTQVVGVDENPFPDFEEWLQAATDWENTGKASAVYNAQADGGGGGAAATPQASLASTNLKVGVSLTALENAAADFSAGFGDTIYFGATKWIRNQTPGAQMVNTASDWYTGGTVAGVAHAAAFGGALTLRPLTATAQLVTHWGAASEVASGTLTGGSWVMTGGPTIRNWLLSGTIVYRSFANRLTQTVPGSTLRYPNGIWGAIKGLIGQRLYFP